MLRGVPAPSFSLVALAAIAGCSGGGGVGDPCTNGGDCASSLQCLNTRCVPRCVRAPDCGDGYACDDQGLCQLAGGQRGDNCTSQVDCEAGLACQLDDGPVDPTTHRLVATCTVQNAANPAGAACSSDTDCRNTTCALGRCVDLCGDTRDCGQGTTCMAIPRASDNGEPFTGCLPSQGSVSWTVPVTTPSTQILLPIPALARSAELVMSTDDPTELVGAESVLSPGGDRIYQVPCFTGDPTCAPDDALDQYFANKLRHAPGFVQSVLAIPSTSTTGGLELGAYHVQFSSFRPDGTRGSSVPRVTAVVQLDTGVTLDLHFFFLQLGNHPCLIMPADSKLDATTAPGAAFFLNAYLGQLRAVFAHAGLDLGTLTYDDIGDRPDLDGLDVHDAGALLSLGKYPTGVNVFFVRSLAPIGLSTFGPNPGPAGLAGTPQSGIVISLDALCYQDWSALALVTAHQIARYMGLYHNVELATPQHPTWRDPINDGDDTTTNLMYFTGPSGADLSAGQRSQLTRSAVLR